MRFEFPSISNREKVESVVLKVDSMSEVLRQWIGLGKPKLEDIILRGESLISEEKDEAQIFCLEISKQILASHLSSLNLGQLTYDINRVTYQDYNLDTIGSYAPYDWIFIARHSDTDLSLILHEMCHAIGSKNQDQLSNRIAKSGFDSVWQSEDGAETNKYFCFLNEAVTEKLSMQLVAANEDIALQCSKKNTPERVQALIADLEQKKNIALLKKDQELVAEVEFIKSETAIKLEKDLQKSDEDHERFLREELSEVAPLPGSIGHNSHINHILESHEHAKKFSKEFIVSGSALMQDYKIESSTMSTNLIESLIKLGYDSSIESAKSLEFSTPYEFNITVLDFIISKIAVYQDKTKNDVWREIQIAYFEGNILYWKVLKNIFPDLKDAVRFMATFDDKSKSDKNQLEALIQ